MRAEILAFCFAGAYDFQHRPACWLNSAGMVPAEFLTPRSYRLL